MSTTKTFLKITLPQQRQRSNFGVLSVRQHSTCYRIITVFCTDLEQISPPQH